MCKLKFLCAQFSWLTRIAKILTVNKSQITVFTPTSISVLIALNLALWFHTHVSTTRIKHTHADALVGIAYALLLACNTCSSIAKTHAHALNHY